MGDIWLAVMWIGLGLAALTIGAEWLVRGASRVAAAARISPLIIGLTVVAFGTSSPELAVSVKAALGGQTDLSFGNVVGSNTFNVLFILGAAALMAPLVVARQILVLDTPIMIGASVVCWLRCLDGHISRVEGAFFFGGLILYVLGLIWFGQRAGTELQKEFAAEYGRTVRGWRAVMFNVGLLIVGLGMLVVGSHWCVAGATALAEVLGVSQLVIGLTIVAIGTSLPELATSVVAAAKGERDIAVGNIVGSNIFNLLGVLGVSAAVSKAGLALPPEAVWHDTPLLVVVAIICLPLFFTSGGIVRRWEGAVLIAFYLAYTIYIVMRETDHPHRETFGFMALAALTPAALFMCVIEVIREVRRKRHVAGEGASGTGGRN